MSKVTMNDLRLETGVRKSLAIRKGINLSSEKEMEGSQTSVLYKRSWWAYGRGLSVLKPIFLYVHI